LGGPFLFSNSLIIDHETCTCIDKKTGYDLLNPTPIKRSITKPTPRYGPELKKLQKKVIAEIKGLFLETRKTLDNAAKTPSICPIAAIQDHIEQIVSIDNLKQRSKILMDQYHDIFPPDIPDTCELPDDVLMKIKLHNDITPMVARAYSCPKKYRNGWKTLIEQHLATRCIRLSNSDYVSPAFIVPKANSNILPRWVNNYRKLNSNTVADNHPLPLVVDILRDCASHNFYGKIDMTNSFFQTQMDPESIKFTAVNTPFGLYKWCVMPMGLRNSPAVHQRQVTSTLRSLIGCKGSVAPYLYLCILWLIL
jgi:hypothetical protein